MGQTSYPANVPRAIMQVSANPDPDDTSKSLEINGSRWHLKKASSRKPPVSVRERVHTSSFQVRTEEQLPDWAVPNTTL